MLILPVFGYRRRPGQNSCLKLWTKKDLVANNSSESWWFAKIVTELLSESICKVHVFTEKPGQIHWNMACQHCPEPLGAFLRLAKICILGGIPLLYSDSGMTLGLVRTGSKTLVMYEHVQTHTYSHSGWCFFAGSGYSSVKTFLSLPVSINLNSLLSHREVQLSLQREKTRSSTLVRKMVGIVSELLSEMLNLS